MGRNSVGWPGKLAASWLIVLSIVLAGLSVVTLVLFAQGRNYLMPPEQKAAILRNVAFNLLGAPIFILLGISLWNGWRRARIAALGLTLCRVIAYWAGFIDTWTWWLGMWLWAAPALLVVLEMLRITDDEVS